MQVLSQRSAVPAVFARASSSTSKPTGKGKLTPAEKSTLLQKSKRLRKGAFNSYLDPKESGSAVIERRKAAAYNVWEAAESDKAVRSDEVLEYVVPIVEKPKVKVRIIRFPRDGEYAQPYVASLGTRIAASVSQHRPCCSGNPTFRLVIQADL